MMKIDLNCDLGEGFGGWEMGNDAAMIDLATSVNIACGFHAGDSDTMRKTVELAKARGVSVGAHPGYHDLHGFGRRPFPGMKASEIENLVAYQIGALQAIAASCGARVAHVKPHGALANMAAEQRPYADAVSRAVRAAGNDLILVALAGSEQHKSAHETGVIVAREGYADRLYTDDGNLASRTTPGSLYHDPQRAVAQAIGMVFGREVITQSGAALPVNIDTICVHGDGPGAVAIAVELRAALSARGAQLKPLDAMQLSRPAPSALPLSA